MIILVSVAYQFRDLLIFCITEIESKNMDDIRLLSCKIFLTSLAICMCIIQVGGLVSVINGHHYFNGVYLAIDSMAFVGNEVMTGKQFKLIHSFLFSFYLILLHSFILVFVCNFQHAFGEIAEMVNGNETRSTYFYEDYHFGPGEDFKDKLLASFNSPSSITPSNEKEADNDVCFPQLWSIQYDFEPEMLSEPLMIGQTERRDSRFSEIFNAQKDLFEPIIEGAENYDDDLSDTSSYKSTKDYFMSDKLSLDLEKDIRSMDETYGLNEESSSGQSTPTGNYESQP